MTDISSKNPATGDIVETVVATDPSHLSAIIARAKDAQRRWAQLSIKARARYLLRLRSVIFNQQDAIAALIATENGKPIAEALSADIFPVLDILTLYAKKAASWLKPESLCLGKWNLLGRTSAIHYHPIGVIGVIAPWNFPFSIPMGQLAASLIAGNSLILKPSEITPRIGRLVETLCRDAGFPDNLVQVISGDGRLGALLASHPDIDKVVFTGSVETGKKVMAAASPNLTPVTLELGGKDAMIVCRDADLEVASSAALWGAFSNCGQCCASVERVYVDRRVYDSFVKKVLEKAQHLRVGPFTQTVDIGPMTFDRQKQKVSAHVDDAIARGATILWQAKTPSTGYFYPPTILSNVTRDFPIVSEETFGPIMPVLSFDDESDLIDAINDSPYGLTASIWSKNIAHAKKLAARIHAGTVMINEVLYTFALGQTPWGGPKDSGIGRTHGRLGLLELVEVKHIHTHWLSCLKSPWWYPYSKEKVLGLKALTAVFFHPSWFGRLRALPALRFLRDVR